MTVDIRIGDCRELLAAMPDESAHCVVTSPPYWGLRDYGVPGQLGLEPTLGEHIETMVAVFREVRRVLRKDGTVWLNYGDCYAGGGRGGNPDESPYRKQATNAGSLVAPTPLSATGLKPKDLCMVPNRLAIALQDDGWWVRSEIIWAKPNPMPESVRDRPTSAHEKVFLLSKSERYFFDAEAVSESANPQYASRYRYEFNVGEKEKNGQGRPNGASNTPGIKTFHGTRNIRNVWTIATQPFPDAHFATFPPALVEPCIKAGTSGNGCCPECGAPWTRKVEKDTKPKGRSSGNIYTAMAYGQAQSAVWGKKKNLGGDPRPINTIGWYPSCSCYPSHEDAPGCFTPRLEPCVVLDPFGGSGTVGLVADRLGRDAILIELNEDYAATARRRIDLDAATRGRGPVDIMSGADLPLLSLDT